ncbi:hypothetical protein SERLA73DRAFT_44750, partial [Serpula lacrymans var. lacrymans S7.3]
KHEGLFIILKKVSPVNYRLKLSDSWKIYPVFHATLLTQYKETEVHRKKYIRPRVEKIND